MAKDETAVEITYRSTELQPPLWVAGSFSNPPWTPLEMKHKTTPQGEHIYTKSISVKPGTAVQYKFRVGSGDWWVLDESLPTVVDDMGNRNNVLNVKARESTNTANVNVQKPPTPPPDSPVLNTTKAGLPHLQVPFEGAPRSDASTPSFVKTTMEVADTAAQIDARTPESEMAEHEVMDSSVDYLDVDIGPQFPHERPGEEDDGLDAAPVFAYEYAGSYELPAGMTAAESEHSPTSPALSAKDKDQNYEDFDPHDPTLERFPSNREDILSRVRTLSTGLDEDTTTFEGFPASPVVGPGHKASIGSIDDFFCMSPTATSNRQQGGARRMEPHKRNTSRESLVFDPSPSPSPSLQCIMEETGNDDRPGALLPEPADSDLLSPSMVPKTASPKSEAVSLNSEAISPKSIPAQLVSPAIVVSDAEAEEDPEPINGTEARTDEHPGAFPTDDEADNNSPTTGTSTQSGARDVVENDDGRSGSPVSRHSTSVGAKGSNSGWFAEFIRLVFIDWLGGFLGRVFGKVFQSRRAE